MDIINWVKLNPIKTVIVLIALGVIIYLIVNVKKEQWSWLCKNHCFKDKNNMCVGKNKNDNDNCKQRCSPQKKM